MAEPPMSLSRANLLMPFVIGLGVDLMILVWTIVQLSLAVKTETTAVAMEILLSITSAVILSSRILDHLRPVLRLSHAL